METTRESVHQQWRQWAQELAGEDRADEIARVALDALAAGADAEQAAALARVQAGRATWVDHGLLGRSRLELEAALRLSATLQPGPYLTPGAIAELQSQLSRRLAFFSSQVAVAAAPAQPAVARPSLREFLAERSIQLLAYSGAFLLAVATLLFDLSGSSPSRLFAVAGLCLAFGLGGALASRYESLRAVAFAYVALAALLLPLVALAAYIFLRLGQAGVPRSLAVAVSAVSCAATYGILARLLASRAFAGMSLLALAIAVGAATAWLWEDRWIGVAVAGLGVACAVASSWKQTAREPFRSPLTAGAFALPAAGAVWGLAWLVDPVSGNFKSDWPLSTALVLTLAAYGVMAGGRRWLASASALWLVAAAFSLAHDLALTGTQAQAVGLGVALVWLVAALPPLDKRLGLDSGTRTLLRLLALLLLAGISWPGFSGAGPQAVFALISVAAILAVVLGSGESVWLLGVGVLATAAWYWLARALLPPKPDATSADLAIVLSPLPVIFGAASMVLRQRLGSSWGWPLYACFGVLGLGVVALALSLPGWQVAGLSLLVYASIGYAIAMLEGQAWGLAAALLAALAGLGCLLAGSRAPGDQYLVGLAGSGAVIYAAGVPLRAALAGPVHRYVAQACVGLAALAAVFTAVAPATIAACALAAAVVLGLDAWLSRAAPSEYLAGLAASLLGVALARQLALGDVLYRIGVPAIALIAAGVRASLDTRLPDRVLLARLATGAGCLLLFGTAAYQSADVGAGDPARSAHTARLAVEAAAGLVAAVGLRSRTLAIASAIALAWAALMAVTLLAEVVPLSLIFGTVALVLIVVATGLALLRGRLGVAGGVARAAWSNWV